jgi:hypothetical protein
MNQHMHYWSIAELSGQIRIGAISPVATAEGPAWPKA